MNSFAEKRLALPCLAESGTRLDSRTSRDWNFKPIYRIRSVSAGRAVLIVCVSLALEVHASRLPANSQRVRLPDFHGGNSVSAATPSRTRVPSARRALPTDKRVPGEKSRRWPVAVWPRGVAGRTPRRKCFLITRLHAIAIAALRVGPSTASHCIASPRLKAESGLCFSLRRAPGPVCLFYAPNQTCCLSTRCKP